MCGDSGLRVGIFLTTQLLLKITRLLIFRLRRRSAWFCVNRIAVLVHLWCAYFRFLGVEWHCSSSDCTVVKVWDTSREVKVEEKRRGNNFDK